MYYLLLTPLYLLSLLPWWLHYVWSDLVLYPLVRYVMRYRLALVRRHLADCFPEKSEAERRAIERRFYHWFADYVVESIKQLSMSRAAIQRHMTFSGLEHINRDFVASDATLCVLYLGHYNNWEWITAINAEIAEGLVGAQVYHPLENEAFDRIMTASRTKFGTANVPMRDTLRYILSRKREGRKVVMGFISDQSPYLYHIRHWMPWMHHESPVIIGAEAIGKKVGAHYLYLDVQRIRRGYYHCTVRPLTPPHSPQSGEGMETAEATTPYPMTEAYMHALAASIQADPAPWLWTHKRWKHHRPAVEQRLRAEGLWKDGLWTVSE